jgi:hypothetical protein
MDSLLIDIILVVSSALASIVVATAVVGAMDAAGVVDICGPSDWPNVTLELTPAIIVKAMTTEAKSFARRQPKPASRVLSPLKMAIRLTISY